MNADDGWRKMLDAVDLSPTHWWEPDWLKTARIMRRWRKQNPILAEKMWQEADKLEREFLLDFWSDKALAEDIFTIALAALVSIIVGYLVLATVWKFIWG